MTAATVDLSKEESIFYATVLKVLNIENDEHLDNLTSDHVTNWNSLTHVRLIVALEQALNKRIGRDRLLLAKSIGDLKHLFLVGSNSPILIKASNTKGNIVHRGLHDVYFDDTEISFIDSENSRLWIRGYELSDLMQSTVEDVIYLLLRGTLPNRVQSSAFFHRLRSESKLNISTLLLAQSLPKSMSLEQKLLTLTASLQIDSQNALQNSISIIAKMPAIIAVALGKPIPVWSSRESIAALVLRVVSGKAYPKEVVRIFEEVFITQMEHGANASSFSARVATSTGTPLHQGIVAAIATFTGPLHGGALTCVSEMFAEVGDADAYVRERHEKSLPVYGFGHRVYRIQDPRTEILLARAKELAGILGENESLAQAEAIVFAMQEFVQKGLVVNVDFYSGLIFRMLKIPQEALTAVFMASRMSGWCAHIMEQRSANRLIRPLLNYVGKIDKTMDHKNG